MLTTSLTGLLATFTLLPHVASLPLDQMPPEAGQDDLIVTEIVETDYIPLPNRPAAAQLPKRTLMTSTNTQPNVVATPKPLEKRAGIDAEEYLTSIESLWSAFSATPGSSLVAEISSFIENNKPTVTATEAFEASLSAVMGGVGEQLAEFTAAAGAGWKSLIGSDGDGSESTSGMISTDGGTTYWSLPDYISTWATMNASAQESWRTLNNYVGTYTDTPAATFATGVMITGGLSTTYWRSEKWMATFASLATIDSGMAQISWVKNNAYSKYTTTEAETTETVQKTAGVGVQMFTVSGETSGSPGSSSVQSGVPSSTQISFTGTETSSNLGVSSHQAEEDTGTGNGAGSSIVVVSQTSTGVEASQQTGGNTVSGLDNCANSFDKNRNYVACSRDQEGTLEHTAIRTGVTGASDASTITSDFAMFNGPPPSSMPSATSSKYKGCKR